MKTEDMKSAWRDTAQSLESSSSNDQLIEMVLYGKRVTALDRLRSRYRRFFTCSFLMILWSGIFLIPDILPYTGGIWLTVAFAIYFLTCGLMDLWLYNGIGSIDCLRMPVSEVIRLSLHYRKRHLQFIICLLPMAFAVIGLLAYFCNFDPIIIKGMIAGGAAGLLIGSLQLRKFLRDYRSLTDRE